MKFALLLALIVVAPAHALDAACEPFIKAAEKGVEQPARHSISELAGGMHVEAIVIGNDAYLMTGGNWRKVKVDLRSSERKLNADVRKGVVKLENCRSLGKEVVDGVATSAIAYTITLPGAAPASSTAYIGEDGLVHSQSGSTQKTRYRYSGVSAPVVSGQR